MKPNPDFLIADTARLEAEAEYTSYMKSRLSDRDEDHAKILELNAKIEACNQKCRSIPDQI